MGTLLFDICNPNGSARVRVRVSGLLVEHDTLLLIAHKKRRSIYWLLPGGGVKYGESMTSALEREFREELGITINVHDLLFICDSIGPRGGRHIINVTFRCSYRDGEYHLGRERRLYDFGFFGRDEISGKRLYPPINATLVSILNKKKSELYLGRLWMA
jgi:8-oxo-dGTP diphosphatase